MGLGALEAGSESQVLSFVSMYGCYRNLPPLPGITWGGARNVGVFAKVGLTRNSCPRGQTNLHKSSKGTRFLQGKLIQTGVFLSIFHQQKSTLSHQAASQSLCWRLMRLMVSIGRSSCLDWGMGAMELPGRTVEVCGDEISINIQMVLPWWHIMVMIYLGYESIAAMTIFYLMNINHTPSYADPMNFDGTTQGFHGFWLLTHPQFTTRCRRVKVNKHTMSYTIYQ